MKHLLFTMGYQGLSVEEFLSRLKDAGVEQIIDVRQDPVSRKPGFSKSALAGHAIEAGISYVHVRDAGVSAERRKEVHSDKALLRVLDEYEDEMQSIRGKVAQEVASLAGCKPSVLICYEADPFRCHRSRLARILSRDYSFTVNHLAPDNITQFLPGM